MEGQWNKVGDINYMTRDELVHALTNKMEGVSDEQESSIKQLNIYKTLREEQRQLSSKLEELIWENNRLKIKNNTLSEKLKSSNDFIYTSENILQNCKRNNRLHKCRRENKKLKKQVKELETQLDNLKESLRILSNENENMDEKCIPNHVNCRWED